jgi:hypothetical protein
MCPACKKTLPKESLEGVQCETCDRRYPREDDVLNLLLDPTMDTMLDLEEYEAWRPMDPAHSEKVYTYYRGVIERHQLAGGNASNSGRARVISRIVL